MCRIWYHRAPSLCRKSLNCTSSFAPHLVPFARVSPIPHNLVSLLLQHNMPFWRITNHADLVSLHQALELDFLWGPGPKVAWPCSQQSPRGLNRNQSGDFLFHPDKEIQPVEVYSRRFFPPVAAFLGEPTKPWQCSSGARMVLCVFFWQRERGNFQVQNLQQQRSFSLCSPQWYYTKEEKSSTVL